ncbi:MAG: hypothetical protein CM15mP71_0500 [Candidatus Poseidoniales archaeon]|nr:MAG: hypothetical protein CM15mP71_0500 [Candidatus Poseidoniales archaeon]
MDETKVDKRLGEKPKGIQIGQMSFGGFKPNPNDSGETGTGAGKHVPEQWEKYNGA